MLKIGFDTIFEHEEEKLVGHITYMAAIGYGYNISGIQCMAKDYTVSLGKPTKAKESLSNNWLYGFIKRWPNLKIVKPQKLSIARAKFASRESLESIIRKSPLYWQVMGLMTNLRTYIMWMRWELILNIHPQRLYVIKAPYHRK